MVDPSQHLVHAWQHGQNSANICSNELMWFFPQVASVFLGETVSSFARLRPTSRKWFHTLVHRLIPHPQSHHMNDILLYLKVSRTEIGL